MAIATDLPPLLGIRHPIVLAPMGGVSGGALAAAVSAAGGLGLIGAGYASPAGGSGPEWIEKQFAAAGDTPVGIGFITWSLAEHPRSLDTALAHRPIAVMLSFGDPTPFVERIKAADAKLVCQVQTVADARRVAAAGADIVVAQGTEAGGHGAGRATFTLVPAVVDAVSPVPVLAAGGIADGRGLAAALMLGASGALIGTRFYAAEEALGHPEAKARIAAAAGDQTVRTRVFDMIRGYHWPAPFTGRAVVNGFTKRWHGHEAELAEVLEEERPRYHAAAEIGDVDTAVVFAGECIDLIHDVRPAGEIVQRIAEEAQGLLSRSGRA